MGPNRTVDGYQYVIGASDLGRCTKASAAEWLGYSMLAPSDEMQAIYDRGTDHEEECVAVMESEDWTVVDRQREYVIPCGVDHCVVVHVDGLAVDGNVPWDQARNRVLEIKSPATWHNAERAFRTHTFTDPYMHRIAWQVSCQMAASGMEAIVACVEDGKVLTFGVEVPPFQSTDIAARVEEIATIVTSGTLPQLCSQRDYPCPVVYLHEDATDLVDDPALDMMVQQYEEFGMVAKDLDAKKKDLAARIRAHVTSDETVTSGGSKVTVYQQASPTRYDMDAMRRDGVDVDKYAIVGKTSERVKITRSDP